MKSLLTLTFLNALFLIDNPLHAKTWTSAKDGKTIECDYISHTSEKVTLKRIKDSKIIHLNKAALIKEDWQWIEDNAISNALSKNGVQTNFAIQENKDYTISYELQFNTPKEIQGKPVIMRIALPIDNKENIHYIANQKEIKPPEFRIKKQDETWSDWTPVIGDSGDKYKVTVDEELGTRFFELTFNEKLPIDYTQKVEVNYFVTLGKRKFEDSMKKVPMASLDAYKTPLERYLKDYDGSSWDSDKYLQEYLGSDSDIANRSIYENMELIYNGVIAKMTYQAQNTKTGLDTITATSKGHCGMYSKFIGNLGVKIGIPTRYASGMTIDMKKQIKKRKPGHHCWGEFYVPDHGWVPFDATFAEYKDWSPRFIGQLKDKKEVVRLVNQTRGARSGVQVVNLYYKNGDKRRSLTVNQKETYLGSASPLPAE